MPNYNPNTGLAFGVISFNSLKSWCLEDLFYGDQARDLSYEAALEELKSEARAKYADLLDQAETAANETDGNMAEREREAFIESWFVEREALTDRDEFVDDYVERGRDQIQIDEAIIEGTYDGVTYRISWLGGAPLLSVFDGPQGVARSRCSPCVPGAADLDSGFLLDDEMDPAADYSHWTGCHCVPRSWMREDE